MRTVSTCLAATCLLWCALVAWRPVVLGFYHDDWWSLTRPISLTPLGDLIANDPSRGVALVLYWSLRSLFGGSAVAWQGFAAGVNLLCALAIGFVVRQLPVPAHARVAGWSCVAAAALWLSAPWSLAYTAWPIMSVPLLSLAALAVSGAMLLTPGASVRNSVFAAGIYVLGASVYEAIWGAFLPVSLLAYLLCARFKRPMKTVFVYAACAGAGQAFLAVVNRLLSGGPHGKKLASNAPDLVVRSLTDAPQRIADTLGTVKPLVLLSASALAGLFILSVLLRRDVVSVLVVLCCVAGIVVAAAVHAAGGYGLDWGGLMGRTAMVPSFWIALAFGAALAACIPISKSFSLTAALASAVLVAALSYRLAEHSKEWATGWREQRAILATFPVDEAERLQAGAFIIADVPRGADPGRFDAFWDISGALITTFPHLSRILLDGAHGRATALRPGDWWTLWDGSALSQGWCRTPDVPLWSFPATHVVVWKQESRQLVPLSPGSRLGCSARAPAAPSSQ